MANQLIKIPGGTFVMGRNDTPYPEERPAHSVTVETFEMQAYPVTNAEYKEYCDATGTAYPANPNWKEMPDYFLQYPEHPVVNLNHTQMKAYAAWCGLSLPTEEQWEWAARGGLEDPLYPWGNENPKAGQANYADADKPYGWSEYRFGCGSAHTTKVGSFPPNGYGLYDMAGNVWEYVEDWYFAYDDTVRDESGFFEGWGGSKICRGGCYYSNKDDLRVSRRRRVTMGSSMDSIGFRCVKNACDSGERDERVGTMNPLELDSEKWQEQMDGMDAKPKDATELTIEIWNMTETQSQRARNAGFTSNETYVFWNSIEGAAEGEWDFSKWDEQVDIMRKTGMKWVPFLIAGPAYSLPQWYRDSKDFHGYRCLEHNIESGTQSLFDPGFPKYVERFIKAFADRYRDSGVLESVLLGITGDFGEAIMPVWHGNWCPSIIGLYHSHPGYWCGDMYARACFCRAMKEKFGTVEALNAAWGTHFACFACVEMPPMPETELTRLRVDEDSDRGQFPMETVADRRRWLDFVDWYRACMTEYADLWMGLARKYFPDTPVYLCTGGAAEPWHASQFAHQSKIAAKHGGGVRITNEGSNYTSNFAVTNWVGSACRFYNGYAGYEPASLVDPVGMVCRIYNMTATGARNLHYKGNNLFSGPQQLAAFAANYDCLYQSAPKTDFAMLHPDTAFITKYISQGDMTRSEELLRDYTDYRFVDESMIVDGVLEQVRFLVLAHQTLLRQAGYDAIRAWVEKGGTLIGINLDKVEIAETGEIVTETLFPAAGASSVGAGRSLYIPFRDIDLPHTGQQYVGTQAISAETAEKWQANIFTPLTQLLAAEGYTVADGQVDKVFVADLTDHYLVYSPYKDVEKVLHTEGGDVTVSLAANRICRVEK